MFNISCSNFHYGACNLAMLMILAKSLNLVAAIHCSFKESEKKNTW